jgi:transposase
MQKALTQMNLLLHNVISDITGVTGLAIIDSILAGERDPKMLARFRDRRIKASEEEIAKSLVGDYREEHLFTLRQSLEAIRFFQNQMAACDAEIGRLLAEFDSKVDIDENSGPKGAPRRAKPKKNEIVLPNSDLRQEMYRINGVDLTAVPGIEALTAHTIFCEIGNDLTKFPSSGHFASYLGFCPNNRISGGKVLFNQTRPVKSRAAQIIKLAAQSVANSASYLGDSYRRIRARSGPRAANVATAHKLARIIFRMLTTKEPYDEKVFNSIAERFKNKRILNLQKQAAVLGYNLEPV